MTIADVVQKYSGTCIVSCIRLRLPPHIIMRLITTLLTIAALTTAHPDPLHKPLTWTLTPTNSSQQFRGLAPVSKKVVWVSGTNGTVLCTTNSGASWSDVSPSFAPSENASDFQFRDIHAFSSSSAVILSIGEGNLSRIYTTHDAGRTWKRTFVNEEEKAFYDGLAFSPEHLRYGVATPDPVGGKLRLLETRNGREQQSTVDSIGM